MYLNLLLLCTTILFIITPKSQPIGADLILDGERMANSMYISEETYRESDCEINECLMHLKGGPFPITRKLLRFDTRAVNIGNRDFNLGNPFDSSNFNFIYDPCHQHYHFENFAEYKVFSISDINRINNLVPETGKRAFCLMDSAQAPNSLYNGVRRDFAQFDCANQGISVGWQDIYGANLDCQFVDITNLDPGSYQLVVTLNPVGALNEIRRDNNEAVLNFDVGSGRLPGEIQCNVPRPEWLGDGYCDRQGAYNTAECNFDRGDCCMDCCRDGPSYTCGSNGYNCQDPNCEILETPEMIGGSGIILECNDVVSVPQWVGDGYCDGAEYNIAVCNYDGGDCCEQSCLNHVAQGLKQHQYTCGEGGYTCVDPLYTTP